MHTNHRTVLSFRPGIAHLHGMPKPESTDTPSSRRLRESTTTLSSRRIPESTITLSSRALSRSHVPKPCPEAQRGNFEGTSRDLMKGFVFKGCENRISRCTRNDRSLSSRTEGEGSYLLPGKAFPHKRRMSESINTTFFSHMPESSQQTTGTYWFSIMEVLIKVAISTQPESCYFGQRVAISTQPESCHFGQRVVISTQPESCHLDQRERSFKETPHVQF